MHVNLGGYHIGDINFVAAFDIDANKVGKDLVRGHLHAAQQHLSSFADVPPLGVRVHRGMTHDGLGKYLSQIITQGPRPDRRHRAASSRSTETHVVINYLPVGSEEATKWYVEQVLTAGCGLINCIPGVHRP